jgi:hypothetical protein
MNDSPAIQASSRVSVGSKDLLAASPVWTDTGDVIRTAVELDMLCEGRLRKADRHLRDVRDAWRIIRWAHMKQAERLRERLHWHRVMLKMRKLDAEYFLTKGTNIGREHLTKPMLEVAMTLLDIKTELRRIAKCERQKT